MSELNIYQRINAVMKEQLYVKKGSAGQGTGVGYDDLILLLSPLLVKYGIVVTSETVGESSARETKKGSYIYQCQYLIHYINMDNPTDKFTTTIESHAMDSGDKAPGKAITYATKTSMLKVFSIQSGDGEESRAGEMALLARRNKATRTDLMKYIQESGYTTEQVCTYFNCEFAQLNVKNAFDAVTEWTSQQ